MSELEELGLGVLSRGTEQKVPTGTLRLQEA